MRRDLIIGIFASVLFHVTFIYGGDIANWLFPNKPKPKVAVVVDKPEIELIMPPLEPDKPEVIDQDSSSTDAIPIDLAPPMQTDVPSIAMADSFVQTIQPPPPEGVKPNPGLVTIPPSRNLPPSTTLTNIFNLAELDQRPQERYQAKPIYPYEMNRAGITGEVTLGFIVDTNGDVRDVYVIRSTQREFEASAIQALQKWRFRAGKKGGKPVNTRMQLPIVFSLNEE